ncbi:GNAT family N-acetyltransferase [Streptomyces sp. NRRL S-1448]|uniref:GNAT family N-acetyltransferase n=1 Tax=Streptomyces sp. NRRL S-1448 TaxID=1463883 RepID=UPI00099D8418|nr:GNAT family N-acetyltransferase [Streptomyces sp. NRRL S-1448]
MTKNPNSPDPADSPDSPDSPDALESADSPNSPGSPNSSDSPSSPVIRLDRYTRAEQNEILGDLDDPFSVAETGLTWRGKDVHFGIRHGARLVAHAGLVRLPLTIDDTPTEVVGVGGVAVAADVRGCGLARRVAAAALEHARTMGPRHALLFCRPPLEALYRRLGWHRLDGDVVVEQPESRLVVMPLRTMVISLQGDVPWPSGRVRLLSLPM